MRWDGAAYRTGRTQILPVRRLPGGEAAVTKVFRDAEEYLLERTALRHWNTVGPSDPSVHVVRLLEHDDDLRMLLLERVAGERLDAGWPDARADAELTADLARAIRALWSPPQPGAAHRDLASWMRALDPAGPAAARLEPGLLARARDLATDLRHGPDPAVVLHGDLHHENVLRAPDGTLNVIDPKGILGDRGFDVGALLWNPWGRLTDVADPLEMTRQRLEVLAGELRLDRDRVRAWGWVACVLSAAWEAEDGKSPEMAYALRAAELVERA